MARKPNLGLVELCAQMKTRAVFNSLQPAEATGARSASPLWIDLKKSYERQWGKTESEFSSETLKKYLQLLLRRHRNDYKAVAIYLIREQHPFLGAGTRLLRHKYETIVSRGTLGRVAERCTICEREHEAALANQKTITDYSCPHLTDTYDVVEAVLHHHHGLLPSWAKGWVNLLRWHTSHGLPPPPISIVESFRNAPPTRTTQNRRSPKRHSQQSKLAPARNTRSRRARSRSRAR
jgi:hypothetical protein